MVKRKSEWSTNPSTANGGGCLQTAMGTGNPLYRHLKGVKVWEGKNLGRPLTSLD